MKACKLEGAPMKPRRAILIRELPSIRTDWAPKRRVIFVRKADKFYIADWPEGDAAGWWAVFPATPDGQRDSFWWLDRDQGVASRTEMLRAIQWNPKL